MDLDLLFESLWWFDIANEFDKRIAEIGREPNYNEQEALTRFLRERVAQMSAMDHYKIRSRVHQSSVRLMSSMKNLDLVLTPSLGCDPIPIGSLDSRTEVFDYETYFPEGVDINKSSMFEMIELLKLKNYAESLGVIFFSTPGDLKSLIRLIKIKVAMIKISSGLATNLPLINEALKRKIPTIISTGFSTKKNLDDLKKFINKFNFRKIAILKCTSIYPASPSNLDLNSISFLKNKFKNVSAISFTTYHNELMINFTGFESKDDLKEFADFVFAKIKMRYSHMEDPPTIH